MRSWDIFCTVVDNYGDIGVCWRLARQLVAEQGQSVRLWVDDLASFRRICPEIEPGLESQQRQGVEIRLWREPFAPVEPADVVVEAFACNPPQGYLAAMAARRPKPAWINLEYLSAESWVRGCHALPSPQPALDLVKYFFFPGFVDGTGGLLAERGLVEARTRFQACPAEQDRFWEGIGLPPAHRGELQVSLFCYPHAGIGGLFEAWAEAESRVRCLVPEGTAREAISSFFGAAQLSPGTALCRGALELRVFPFLDQDRYDRLLWACDFNLVRGEDSFVRAQWAARPLLWHIYPQSEGAHWPKLEAFLELYCAGLAPAPAAAVGNFWRAWNRGEGAALASAWSEFWARSVELRAHAGNWAASLGPRADLANRLAAFARNLLK